MLPGEIVTEQFKETAEEGPQTSLGKFNKNTDSWVPSPESLIPFIWVNLRNLYFKPVLWVSGKWVVEGTTLGETPHWVIHHAEMLGAMGPILPEMSGEFFLICI